MIAVTVGHYQDVLHRHGDPNAFVAKPKKIKKLLKQLANADGYAAKITSLIAAPDSPFSDDRKDALNKLVFEDSFDQNRSKRRYETFELMAMHATCGNYHPTDNFTKLLPKMSTSHNELSAIALSLTEINPGSLVKFGNSAFICSLSSSESSIVVINSTATGYFAYEARTFYKATFYCLMWLKYVCGEILEGANAGAGAAGAGLVPAAKNILSWLKMKESKAPPGDMARSLINSILTSPGNLSNPSAITKIIAPHVGNMLKQLHEHICMVYTQVDVSSEDSDEARCSICLGSCSSGIPTVTLVPCGHIIHDECRRSLVAHARSEWNLPTCPQCRQPFQH